MLKLGELKLRYVGVMQMVIMSYSGSQTEPLACVHIPYRDPALSCLIAGLCATVL